MLIIFKYNVCLKGVIFLSAKTIILVINIPTEQDKTTIVSQRKLYYILIISKSLNRKRVPQGTIIVHLVYKSFIVILYCSTLTSNF